MAQFDGRWIRDNSVPGAKIINIALSKIVNFSQICLNTGFTMAANIAMGGNRVTGLGTATNNDEAVNLGQMNAAIAQLSSIFDSKPSPRAQATGNVNLASPGATMDGVTLSLTGTNGGPDVVFLGSQTNPAENGLYRWNGAAAALTRIPQMDSWGEFPGATFAVSEGTTHRGKIYYCNVAESGTLGTTAVTFNLVNAFGLVSSDLISHEIPAGAINGTNVTFTLANTPVGAIDLFLYPLILRQGDDFTISGNTITMAVAPLTGEVLAASYKIR